MVTIQSKELQAEQVQDSFEYLVKSTRTGRSFFVTWDTANGVGWDAEATPWRPGIWPVASTVDYNGHCRVYSKA